ncbi:MAG: winged helix-turn-helix domain-containing protein [Myxococcota bacterium]
MQERIVVCEDEEDVGELIAHHLRQSGWSVVRVGTGAECMENVLHEPPALLLLDLILPDVSGMYVLRRLREEPKTRSLPVILVTARSEEIDRVVGFELGADDYVPKPFSPRELTLRVQALLRRAREGSEVRADRMQIGPLFIDVARHEVRMDGQPVDLTALEFRLLLDLARHCGRVQRREELLERVWRYPGSLDTRTVDTHIKRLREKLGDGGAWIETVRGVGYRLRRD